MSADSSAARWLGWARRLQAIAQTGLTYAADPFDVERYEAVRQIAAEMLVSPANEADVSAVLGLFCADTGYATPKIDVRGVVFDPTGALLLVRERSDGKWTLPGGWADVGCSATENVVREIREESGYEARAAKVLAVYDRNKQPHPPMLQHVYKFFIHCEIVGGAPASGGTLETSGVGFFPSGALPELSTGRVTASQLARMFEHHRQPDLPTDFD